MTGNPEERTEQEQRAAEAVRGLEPVRPDPAFRKRLGQAFASGSIAAPAPATVIPLRRSRRSMWIAAAAAVLIFAFFLRPDRVPPTYLVMGGHAVGTAVVDGKTVPLADLRETGVPGGTRITVLDGALELRWDDLLAARVHPGQVTVPDPRQPGAMVWDLAQGEVLVQTGPGFPGRRLRVRTPEGIAEVVGTSFAVYRDDGATCVCVLEGQASVGVNAADLESIPPGRRKVMHADGSPSEILDIMPAHRDGLMEFVDRAKAGLAR
ncbi:MAG: hypothetical protein DHS20C21_12100 [Gemmatimonadota bacterium]|nr:MAG: hypothetical protein DHS20C21_12100 [Gemmatimonadota bacterium]